ncbi:MAG: hypothetical protein QOF51_1266 [Chloroflexota bacterium]|jgi:predicted metal-dependent hydrolase|nr:hypothetical protein [Chloroflexota bacterium]
MSATEAAELRISGSVIPYVVVRSRRRRRTLTLSVVDGAVRVAVPWSTPAADVHAFVVGRAAWIAGRLAQHADRPPRFRLEDGAQLPLAGGIVAVVVESIRNRFATAVLDGAVLRVGIPHRFDALAGIAAGERALFRWLRAHATADLEARVAAWTATTGWIPKRVLVRDQRRRWGSCAGDGTVRLNWRLVFLAPHLADYVVVHELAHLAVHSHAPAFWAQVSRFVPDHRARRAALNRASRDLPF